jgi:hypothetical protein
LLAQFFFNHELALQYLVNEVGNALSLAHAENVLTEKLDTLLKNLQGHLVQKLDLLVAIRNKHYTFGLMKHSTYAGSFCPAFSCLRWPL